MAAALSVMAERGYHDAQVSEIAARAEVSLAGLYGLFSSKEEIYEAVVLATARTIRERLAAEVLPIPDPARRLLALIEELFACFEDNRAAMRIFASATPGLIPPLRDTAGRRLTRIHREFIHAVAEITREVVQTRALADIDPEVLATAVVGAVLSTAGEWLEAKPQRSLREAAPALQAIFSRVIGSPSRRRTGSGGR